VNQVKCSMIGDVLVAVKMLTVVFIVENGGDMFL
jgi:hypothetical protein